MTLYRDIDKEIVSICDEYIRGDISVGSFQDALLRLAHGIESLEDRDVRNKLLNLEASLDVNLALYLGAEGIDKLDELFFTQDKTLQESTKDIVEAIKKSVS